MSTRATVWIKNKGDNRFLFHHYDGYGLDEDIDPVLSKLPNEDWTLDGVAHAVKALEFGDTYHEVDCVGWDSEYIYVIDVDERTLKKYYVGICNYDTSGEIDTTMRIESGEMEMAYYYSESYNAGPMDDIPEKEQKPVDIDYISGIRDELLGIEDSAKDIDGLTESQWVAIRAAHRLLGEYIEKEQKQPEVDFEKLALEKYPVEMVFRDPFDERNCDDGEEDINEDRRDVYLQGLKVGYELRRKGGKI